MARLFCAITLLVWAISSSPSYSENLGNFEYWGAFRSISATDKTCYAGSFADSHPVPKGAQPFAFFALTSRPAKGLTDEVSIEHKNLYPVTNFTEAYLSVDDGERFYLYTSPPRFWLQNSASQSRLLDAMRTGNRIDLTLRTATGRLYDDFWFIAGLTSAINRAHQACDLPPLSAVATQVNPSPIQFLSGSPNNPTTLPAGVVILLGVVGVAMLGLVVAFYFSSHKTSAPGPAAATLIAASTSVPSAPAAFVSTPAPAKKPQQVMPVRFWIPIGLVALAIISAIAGNWSAAIAIFVLTGLGCAVYEKLDDWALVPEPKTKTAAPDIAWHLTPWNLGHDGNWIIRPTITVNGVDYTFNSPFTYIQVLERINVTPYAADSSRCIAEFKNAISQSTIQPDQIDPIPSGLTAVLGLPKETRPVKPNLPPPVMPADTEAPVLGIMRVDITRTNETVDVFIKLSEQAKFILEQNDLRYIPVAENFEGLKRHMQEFAEDYDLETARKIDDPVLHQDPYTKSGMIHKEVVKQVIEGANTQRDAQRQAERKYALEDEEKRYKREHTVTLGDYLAYPHRHVVANPVEANLYIDNLKKQYLPKIKALLEISAPDRHAATERLDY